MIVWAGLSHIWILVKIIGIVVDLEWFYTLLGVRVSQETTLAAIALMLSGAGIYFGRSWGYYLAYLVTLSGLLPGEEAVPYVPFSPYFAHGLWTFLAIRPDATIVVLDLVFAGLLAWTQFSAVKYGQIDYRLSLLVRRRIAMACLIASGFAILLPILLFAYGWAVDPPGGRNPGGPSGGLVPLIAFFLGGPTILVGLIGAFISWKVLKKNSRTDAKNSSEPSVDE